MASCNMASAACGLVVAPANVISDTSSRITMLSFNHVSRNRTNHFRRLVVRAAEEAASPSTTTAELEVKAAPKPPPIGPKRGTKVKT